MTSSNSNEKLPAAPPSEKNPLMEGLSLASTAAEIFPLIARNPFKNKNWLQQHQDIDLFPAYMREVVVPTEDALNIGLALHRALKISLHQKNPCLLQNHRDYFSTSQGSQKEYFAHPSHTGLVLSGLTGLGKSHLLGAGLRTIPQVIHRTNIPGLKSVDQITWILLDITTIASIDALAEQIVHQIDDLLNAGGIIYDMTFSGARSATAKMDRALRRLVTHFVSIVAVDEIQPNNFAKRGAEPLRDWYLRIANQGTALVFSGNPLGFHLNAPGKKTDQALLSTQLMRRLFASTEIRRDPAEFIDNPNWNLFARALGRCHLNGRVDLYNKEHELLKLKLTGGFEDFYVELHCQLELIRHRDPMRVIDENMIIEAAQSSTKLKKMHPLIVAFANQNSIMLQQCIDVDHKYYLNKWTSQKSDNVSSSSGSNAVSLVSSDALPVDHMGAIKKDTEAIKRAAKHRSNKKDSTSHPITNAIILHHLDELESIIKS